MRDNYKFDDQEWEDFLMGKEIWRDIDGYDGYKISSMGRFMSLKRENKWKILKPDISDRGYYRATLCKEGKIRKWFIHGLVCRHFINNPLNKPQTNHINGVKSQNHCSNLEWCTQGENNSHAYRTGLSKGSAYGKTGKLSACSKPIAQFTKFGRFCGKYDSIREASKASGVDSRRISDNALGKKPGGGGYNWIYVEKPISLQELKNNYG